MRLFVLSEHLNLTGVWSGDDQGTNIIKTCVQKRFDYIFKNYVNIHVHILHFQKTVYMRGPKSIPLLFYSFFLSS